MGKEGRKPSWVICDKWCLPLVVCNDEILPRGGASAEKMHAMESEGINNDEILKYDASMMQV